MSEIFKKICIVILSLFFCASLAVSLVASEFETFVIVMWYITAGFLMINILLHFRTLKLFLKSRLCKNICLHSVNLFFTVGIFGMINYLVYKNNKVIDFTKSKIHTLSAQSKDTIRLLEQRKLHFQLFATKATWERYLSLLELYHLENPNISIELLDVEKELGLVGLHNIRENGTLIITLNEKSYKTIATNELAVTNLLLKILNPRRKIVYYSVGHNEISLTDKNEVGGDFLREKILDSQFELRSLEMQNGIPSDASAVMILNPQIEFLPMEIENLENYLNAGGGLITSLSPQFNGVMIKNYLQLLGKFGVDFKNGIIIDRLATQQGSQASIPVVNTYGDHKITKNFIGRSLFPISSYLKLENTDYVWSSIASSTPFPGSWGESNFDEVKAGTAKFDESTDRKGPLVILAAGENNTKKSRVFIASSSHFIANQFQGQTNNFNLFLNALSWVVKEEALMSLNRPTLNGNLVYISEIQLSIIFYFIILIFPFVLFGVSIYFYRKRLSS